MAVFLLFAFSGLLIRRAYRPKQDSTKHGSAATLVRPGFGSSPGCYSPWLPGERGTPLAPGGLGRPHRQPPAGSAGQRLRGSACLHGKERTGPHAHAACNRRVSRRAPGASCGALPAHFAARNRRVLRRAPGASSGKNVNRGKLGLFLMPLGKEPQPKYFFDCLFKVPFTKVL